MLFRRNVCHIKCHLLNHRVDRVERKNGMRKVTAEALKYVAGYVAFKLKGQYPDLGVVSSKVINEQTVCSSSWINALSRGGLRQPSAAWFQSIQNLKKKTFNRHHGTDLSKESGVI
jgi:hypothetical protein